ncbi:MAG: gas vesicle protein GvpD P-loop domain-containing protein [Thermoplasmataceae archaeon]
MSLLKQFFYQGTGKSLIIKGKPGAGKTTFALEFIGQIKDDTPVFYLPARSYDEPLRDKYPWIKEIKSGKIYANQNQVNLNNVVRSSLEKMEKSIEEKITAKESYTFDSGLVFNVSELMPDIEAMYDFVDENMGMNPIIVIDSIDALSETYRLNRELIFSILQKDLVESSGAGLICIMEEKESTKLEYFSDGVITLDYMLNDHFLVRSVVLDKLRGVSVGSSPFFLYTLLNGVFMPFQRIPVLYPETKVEHTLKDESKQFSVSIGNPSLGVLNDSEEASIPLGSVIMIHRVNNTNNVDEIVKLIKNNLVLHTIANGRGVIDASSSNYETSRVMVSAADKEWISHYITAEKSKKSNPYVINIEGKSVEDDFPSEVLEFYLSSSAKPAAYIFSTDYLRFIYGDQFLGGLSNLLNPIRTTGIIMIIADEDDYQKLSHYANMTIHLREIRGYVVANSNSSHYFAASVSYNKDSWPEIVLTEIV